MAIATSAEIWAIVPAAGIGARMRAALPKQYLPLLNHTVIDITLSKLLGLGSLAGVVVALAENDDLWTNSHFAKHEKVHTVIGGESRSDSVLAGLTWCLEKRKASAIERALQGEPDERPAEHKQGVLVQETNNKHHSEMWALVHDAARPCVSAEKIRELLAVGLSKAITETASGAILGVPSADTVKRVRDGIIMKTEDRSELWLAHTPQLFPAALLADAISAAKHRGVNITDEASAMEAAGAAVTVVQDRRDNIKITVAEDLIWAETILQKQGVQL